MSFYRFSFCLRLREEGRVLCQALRLNCVHRFGGEERGRGFVPFLLDRKVPPYSTVLYEHSTVPPVRHEYFVLVQHWAYRSAV